jgi:hypothetical protein
MAHASAVYGDVVLPYPDAKVDFELCHGGPVMYKLQDGCGVGDQWIVENVTPHIAESFGTNMAATLGKALMWACFDDKAKISVDVCLRQRIVEAYMEAAGNNSTGDADGEGCPTNPICKKKLLLYERDEMAVIEELKVAYNATVAIPYGVRTVDNLRPTQQHEAASYQF